MLFNSWEFLFFLNLAFIFYYLPFFKKKQVGVLILASLVFYGYSQPKLLILLFFSVFLNAFVSFEVQCQPVRKAFWIACIGVALNLSLLAVFKYGNLLVQSFVTSSFVLALPLPVGISFYTFEGISIVVDTFRAKKGAAREALLLSKRPTFLKALREDGLLIVFFPHLVAGPILKAREFLPQIEVKNFSKIDWDFAFRATVKGYFLKMVIADNLKEHTSWIIYPLFESWSSVTLIILVFGYSMQIFADFAGYSLIAQGIAALFGYKLPDNFNFPYLSRSFSEFWTRWHISLSTWLKEYLYIPLGGNKHGKIRMLISLMTVMFFGGLWHGGAWSYAVWGTAHGLFLVVERAFGGNEKPKNLTEGWEIQKILKALFVFFWVTWAWLLFKLPHFSHVISYLKAVRANVFLPHQKLAISNIILFSLPVIFYHIQMVFEDLWKKQNRWAYPVIYGTLLFFIMTNSGVSGAFIYFQF